MRAIKRLKVGVVAVVVLLALIVRMTTPSIAASQWTSCEPYHFGPTPADRIFVNVYMNVNTPTVLGLPSASIQRAISDATDIWNEQVSAAVILRWSGVTSYQYLAGGIVVNARADVCDIGDMYTEPHALDGARIVSSYVEIRKFKSSPSCVTPINWSFVPEVGNDMTAALLHELGHGVGFYAHPGQGTCPSTSPDLTSLGSQESIMNANRLGPNPRSIRAFDKHRFADMYAQRCWSSSLRARYWSPSTSTWGPTTGAIASYLAHRPGASQGGSAVLLEWFNRGASGTRGVRKARFIGYLTDIEDFGTDQGNQSEVPGAIAINPATGTAISVYQRRALTALRYGANSAAMEICYRFSSNSGQTFGGPRCVPSLRTSRYGIGAGFDPGSQQFMISYARDSDGSLVLLSFPSANEIDGLNPFQVTLANQSTHGASIACRAATLLGSSECRLAFQNKVTNEVQFVNFGFNVLLQPNIGMTSSLGYLTSDMPSIVFWTYDQTFRLVMKGGHYANYSYKSLPGQTTWTGTGDIVNNFNVPVSTAVLATTPTNLMVFYVQQW